MPSANAQTQSTLIAIRDKAPDTLRAAVAEHALNEYADNLYTMFDHLVTHGCRFDQLNGLTHDQFFDRHYDEIAHMFDGDGEPVYVYGEIKFFFASNAFENTAYSMAVDDLGFDF